VRTTRLRVRLEDVEPAVLRIVDVPATSTVDDVHHVLQAVLGWRDTHLYEVQVGDARYGTFDGEDPDVVDGRTVRLRDLPPSFTYDYDFGDGWSAAVEVLGPGGDEPGLAYGEGDEPEDDIGGAHGYREAEAAGALRPFDAARIGERVRRVLGRVPAGLQLVLDTIGDGVEVTPQGRLPQAVVREIQGHRPEWYWAGDLEGERRPARREDDLRPLVDLHDFVLETRLARHRNGVLVLTKAAADPAEVLRRTRAAFSPDTFVGQVVHYTVALLLAEGPRDFEDLAADLHAAVGREWGVDGRPLTEDDMSMVLAQNGNLLRGLGQVENDGSALDRRWRAGPEAGWWLARTGLLVPERS
jgi:hypothetical protein